MTSCAITHFDSDPLITQFWLMVYAKFWAGQVDTIYANLCIDPALTTPDGLEAQVKMFEAYPEIKVNLVFHSQVPETTNNQLLPKIKEDLVMLTETDNFIFDHHLVERGFLALRLGADIVAPEYAILPPELWDSMGRGYMRSLMFVKRSLIDQIEVDFMPRHVEEGDLDCFGWVCLQLARLDPDVINIPNHNLSPDNAFDRYEDDSKYIHIRQFNSSNLGFGNGGRYFKAFRDNNFEVMDALKAELKDNPSAIWQWVKSVAFRKLMFQAVTPPQELESFYSMYQQLLELVEAYLELPHEQVIALQYYYKGLINL